MTRTNYLAGAAFAAALVLAPGALLAQEAAPAADKAAITSLEDAVRTLTTQVAAQRTETEGLKAQLAARDTQAKELQGAVTAVQSRASGLEQELATAKSKLASAQAQGAELEQVRS